jgi:type II secretory pathway component PulF
MTDAWNAARDSHDAQGPRPDARESLALLIGADLPLEAGLRALGEETPRGRFRRTLLRMSRELANGRPIEEVLSRRSGGLPGYLRGLVKAGVQSGQLGRFLEEFLLTIRRRRSSRQSYWLALLYPLLMLPLALLAVTGMMWLIVPQFASIFEDFGTELPAMTVVLISMGELLSPRLLLGFAAAIIGGLLLLQLMPYAWSPAPWTRFVQSLPLVGPPSRMRGMSEFCSFLGLLVSGRLPLQESLDVTAGALQDANLRAGCRKLSARVAAGDSMEAGARQLPHFSAELLSLLHWETRGEAFGQMLRHAGEVYAARSHVQLGIVLLFFQPLVLLLIGMILGFTVLALFLPLIKLLNDLT